MWSKIKIDFRKGGSFSSQHIHDSEAMKERGIHCVIEQDREKRINNNKILIYVKLGK